MPKRLLKDITNLEQKLSLNVTVTPSAKDGLKQLAERRGISVSELFEQIGQGLIDISI